jgi:apolipoprotein N-acyltransferase
MGVATTQPIDSPGPLAAPGTDLNPLKAAKPLWPALAWAAGAVVSFHAAYEFSCYFIFGYLLGLVQVARRSHTGRQSFYLGLGVGLLTAAPQLNCFWVIFGPSAIALWMIVAFWIALFVALSRLALARLGRRAGFLLIPFLWTGLEYFRSELYYLKFSWINAGYAFAGSPLQPLLKWFGMYGLGFGCMAAVIIVSNLKPKRAAVAALRLALVVVVLLFLIAYREVDKPDAVEVAGSLTVAGIQLEFPSENDVISALDKLKEKVPEANLVVLSEYTLNGPVPETIKAWCRARRQYLVIGGKDPAPGANFYDTAFVVGPEGEIVFKQVKSVPIQFFKDGLPATEQKIWASPWGQIGFCVCYDLSYSRVTDRLIRLGAQAIIVPTMDVIDWGKREHELHARVGLIRAAEYGVPVFRVASSGVSQLIDRSGKEMATAGFPGQGQILNGKLLPAARGSLPVDRVLGPFSVGVTILAVVWMVVGTRAARWTQRARGEQG